MLALSSSARGDEYAVYVLTGQSNMLGTTSQESASPNISGPGSEPSDELTDFFWSNVDATNGVYPPVLYGDSGGLLTSLRRQQGDLSGNPVFWGPEFGFARALHAASAVEDRLLLIKVSRGGGGNGLWDKASFEADNDAGHMWGHLQDVVDQALALLVANGDSFTLDGLLYMQGESNSSAEAAIADVRLGSLAQNLRDHVEAAHPGTAAAMRVAVAEIAASQKTSARELTSLLQLELARNDAEIAFARTHDLPLKLDGIHFGKLPKLEIGDRLAATFLGNGEPFAVGRYDASIGGPLVASSVHTPEAQGFLEAGAGAGVQLEGSLEGGEPAWRVLDDSSLSNPGYLRLLGAVDHAGMYATGWSLSARARVDAGGGLALWSVSTSNDPGWGVGGANGAMNGLVLARLGADELRVSLFGVPSVFVDLGAGSANEFHDFELRGAAESALFDLYVDGALIAAEQDLTAQVGINGFADRLIFNSGQTAGLGRDVRWASLELSSPSMALAPPFCGSVTSYGAGCAGSGGFVPELAIDGCLHSGSTVQFSLSNGQGGGLGLVALGIDQAAIPLGGACQLLVTPVFLVPALGPFSLSPGGAGDGAHSFALPLPQMSSPLSLTFQGFVVDPGAPTWISATAGLAVTIDS